MDPVIPDNIEALNKYQIEFWDYYKDLLEYKKCPTRDTFLYSLCVTLFQG